MNREDVELQLKELGFQYVPFQPYVKNTTYTYTTYNGTHIDFYYSKTTLTFLFSFHNGRFHYWDKSLVWIPTPDLSIAAILLLYR